MKLMIALLIAFSLVACGGRRNAEAPAQPRASGAPLYVIKFHADHCKSCSAIDARLAKLREAAEPRGATYVEFDLTDATTTAAAAHTAEQHGLTAVYQDHAPKTGFVLLVDRESKEVKAKLTKAEDEATWLDALGKL